MSVHMGQSPIQKVPACPIQIRAPHHKDACTDINKDEIVKFFYLTHNQNTRVREH